MPGLHHYHKRKRAQDPDRERLMHFMDRAIYIVGILGPVMTIPQLLVIWMEKTAAGVSLLSWTAYTVFSLFWIGYGILHNDKPIIMTYTLWLIIEVLIVIGIIVYG